VTLDRPNTNTNNFGFRLMTVDGKVTPLNYSDIDKLRADDKDELVLNALNAHSNSLAHLDIPVIIAGKGGSLIIASNADTAEKASALAFPKNQEYDRSSRQTRTAEKVISLKANILNEFDFAASGHFNPIPLKSDFRVAVRPANINGPVFSPDYGDIRLAA
jgi:hypothetical protein